MTDHDGAVGGFDKLHFYVACAHLFKDLAEVGSCDLDFRLDVGKFFLGKLNGCFRSFFSGRLRSNGCNGSRGCCGGGGLCCGSRFLGYSRSHRFFSGFFSGLCRCNGFRRRSRRSGGRAGFVFNDDPYLSLLFDLAEEAFFGELQYFLRRDIVLLDAKLAAGDLNGFVNGIRRCNILTGHKFESSCSLSARKCADGSVYRKDRRETSYIRS